MKISTFVSPLTAAIALLSSTSVLAQSVPPVEAFAHLPTIRDAEFSPSSEKFLLNMNIDERYNLVTFQRVPEMKAITSIPETDDVRFGLTTWANDDKLLLSVRMPETRYGVETIETRLRSMNADGSDVTDLFPRERDWRKIVQIQDNIVSMLRDDPDHVLIEYRKPEEDYTSVSKVDVTRQGRHQTVQVGNDNVYSWYADLDGNVRAGYGTVNDDHRHLRIKLQSTGNWEDFSQYVDDEGESFYIMGFSREPDILWVLSNHESDRDVMYRFNAATNTFEQRLFEDNDKEIYNIRQDRSTGEIIGLTTGDDEVETDWIEGTVIDEAVTYLQSALPGKSISVISLSDDLENLIFVADAPTDPGQVYLFNVPARKATRLPAQYPDLDPASLSPIVRIDYAARDGLNIPGYITLPAGTTALDEVKNAPFIVLPHGGPGARDFQEFDFLAQFLASRGFGVLQMNFRGSEGYGKEFSQAGQRQWGKAMQEDVADGTNWLVEQGYADAGKLVIAGWSYGGYASLMGAIRTPDLYQCAISIAPVTDLPRFVANQRRYVGGDFSTRFIGSIWSDRKDLAENSPVNNAAAITVPVLLIHGEEDRVVNATQSRLMKSALEAKNKDVTYLELPSDNHSITLYGNRLNMLQSIESFLGACID